MTRAELVAIIAKALRDGWTARDIASMVHEAEHENR